MKVLVIGGNRYFGKRLVQTLSVNHDVSVLNRGSLAAGGALPTNLIRVDRKDRAELQKAVGATDWDVVFDQCCYDAVDAKAACEIFSGHVGHYVFTSSQSVYGPGREISESIFVPQEHVFKEYVSFTKDYAEAKRQCEFVFFSNGKFPVSAIRFPIVVGMDDYTGRLKWHVERIMKKEPIFFPNVSAKISLITSSDASNILQALMRTGPAGPLNACAEGQLQLSRMVSLIEEKTGSELLSASAADKENSSPFGATADWYMNTRKLNSLGIKLKPVEEWIPGLIGELVTSSRT